MVSVKNTLVKINGMEGYFLVADLLGFSRIAKNLKPSDLDERMGILIC